MVPHEGMGGCTPMPRKLNPASMRMAAAKLAAEITITGPMMLGSTCLNIILKFLYPSAFPASTNSFSLMLRICPRTTLATSTHMVSPTAIKTCQNPFPNAKVIAITSSRVGIDQTTLMIHTIRLSSQPLKKPAMAPSVIPINRDMMTEINPTDRLTLAPIIRRLSISRP